ncbi:alpha/beta hydrolase [Bradyrhizobium sp. AUGA SZCCT0176]|uniref:alpha/beta fold hydrolase n=1 Tax=unclassified Bradyrhizobium TaxID=2631580 RepID=UPI001BA51B82|nr:MULTISPECIES: alpha/beta hydrolase [unclassified Bradyrhizobium]MBR1225189.1 alpha/beta hydrolase [Bradyrhizobium sp. AUGA SZCCT0176]MBR1281278.1 alpha/beta hydrolase [Bradyrhizobium sp. AUGA SZCCT0177]
MPDLFDAKRRRFLQAAGVSTAGLATLGLGIAPLAGAEMAAVPAASSTGAMGPIKQVRTDVLDIGYYEAGPHDGQVVVLLHGYPYDIHSYIEVAPILEAQGYRVIVPYLRGHGSTCFLKSATMRVGQQGALGADVIALMDALGIPTAIFAGYGWGGRAACVAAAIWPERCKGLISVNGYLIQDIGLAMNTTPPKESGLLYQTEHGRAELAADRRSVAYAIWTRNSPSWRFDQATFERTAGAFDNPDHVDIVIHSHRHQVGLAPGCPTYDAIERLLAGQPAITVPTITLDGEADGNFPASDGSAMAEKFRGPRVHRRIPNAGHNLPQEAPGTFARAVVALMKAVS